MSVSSCNFACFVSVFVCVILSWSFKPDPTYIVCNIFSLNFFSFYITMYFKPREPTHVKDKTKGAYSC